MLHSHQRQHGGTSNKVRDLSRGSLGFGRPTVDGAGCIGARRPVLRDAIQQRHQHDLGVVIVGTTTRLQIIRIAQQRLHHLHRRRRQVGAAGAERSVPHRGLRRKLLLRLRGVHVSKRWASTVHRHLHRQEQCRRVHIQHAAQHEEGSAHQLVSADRGMGLHPQVLHRRQPSRRAQVSHTWRGKRHVCVLPP